MEARLDRANSSFSFCTSFAFTCNFWDYNSSLDAIILHKLQVTDAAKHDALKAVSLDLATVVDFGCSVDLVF